MKITYKTQGTCSSHIEVEVEDDVIQQVFFWGGCNGNLQGISRLVKGMKVEEVLQKTGRCKMRKPFYFLSGSIM